jgi:CelD/BcsL family acetyltransferase involved in cellulose biosynthesis
MAPSSTELEPLAVAVTLTTRVLRDPAELPGLRRDWERLHEASKATTPFSSFDWVAHWWSAFGRPRGWRRDALYLVVQRDPDGVARGIAPFVLTRFGPGPASLCKLRPCGSVRHRNITEIPAPLAWPGFEEACAEGLADVLRSDARAFHWCDLLVPAEGPFHRRLREGLGNDLSSPRGITNYVLSLPDSWETLRQGLRRNIKESLRHCYNSLRRDDRKWVFRLVEDPKSALDAGVDFLKLHRARSAAEKGPMHLDQFPGPAHEAFLHGAMADLMAKGQARYAEMWIDGKLAASRIVFSRGDTAYLYYSGFDQAFARYGVPTTLVAECIKWAIGRRMTSLSLSIGNDFSKTRWGPEPQELAWLRVRGKGPLAGAFRLFA